MKNLNFRYDMHNKLVIMNIVYVIFRNQSQSFELMECVEDAYT